MRVLIIGYGSIGARHTRLLDELGHDMACLTKNPNCNFPVFASVEEAITGFDPEAVVIATATAKHQSSLKNLAKAGFTGRVLVEKPLFQNFPQDIPSGIGPIFVGYNLRFHPLVLRLTELLANRRLISIQAYVGQHLSLWRPGLDFKKTYSAYKDQGGGVLRDLSHELDLIQLIAGPWIRTVALLGTFGDLGIEAEDIACLLLQTENCPAISAQLNSLDPRPRRELLVLTHDASFKVDFVAGTLETPNILEYLPAERDDTYRDQARALTTDCVGLCSLEQGLLTMELIEKIEQNSECGAWIQR